jgi:glycosyltransferase involved in cell wall biosynthesis
MELYAPETPLLNSMMLKRTTIVTTPSTLQEMYIKDGYNGVAIAKDIDLFAQQVCEFLSDDKRRNEIGENARKMYLENFSRYAMGRQIAEFLKKHLGY